MNGHLDCPAAMGDVLQAVADERLRQDEKRGEQNHNPYIYLAIVLEELGELAQAILQTQFGGEKGGVDSIKKEALHTAATAVAVIECLNRNTWTNDDVQFPNWKGAE